MMQKITQNCRAKKVEIDRLTEIRDKISQEIPKIKKNIKMKFIN